MTSNHHIQTVFNARHQIFSHCTLEKRKHRNCSRTTVATPATKLDMLATFSQIAIVHTAKIELVIWRLVRRDGDCSWPKSAWNWPPQATNVTAWAGFLTRPIYAVYTSSHPLNMADIFSHPLQICVPSNQIFQFRLNSPSNEALNHKRKPCRF